MPDTPTKKKKESRTTTKDPQTQAEILAPIPTQGTRPPTGEPTGGSEWDKWIIRSHEQAVEMGRRAGSKRSPAQQIHTALLNRRHCEPSCKLWGIGCPYKEASQVYFKGECGLKAMPPEVQGETIGLLERGQAALAGEMLGNLIRMGFQLKKYGDPDSLRDLLQAQALVHRVLYGDKVKHEGEVDLGLKESLREFLAGRMKAIRQGEKGDGAGG